MPVPVTFPDGEVREVPSHTVFTPSQERGAAPDAGIRTETPDEDPDWRWISGLGGWRAMPKRPT